MKNDMLQEIYMKAEELEKSDFFSEDIDWKAVMLNLTLSGIEEDIKAMKFVRVSNGEIIEP